MRKIFKIFFEWYERNYVLNLTIAAGLFLLQLIHLHWLASDVISERLFGQKFLGLSGIFEYAVILVDYTEIPALIATTVLYLNELRKRFSWKSVLFLGLVNSQWLHLFWITDEFVVQALRGNVFLPVWLAWIAILIDYLEVPVIFDILKKLFTALKTRRYNEIKNILEEK